MPVRLEIIRMLAMRRRGKAQNFYIRGSVSLGDRSIEVVEYSAGTADEDAAAHLMAQKEVELREQLMFGPRAVASKSTMADAFDPYLNKAPKPHSTDVVRVEVMRTRIGKTNLADAKAAWHGFRDRYLLGHAPAGQDYEPPRVCRRLQLPRRWSRYEQDNEQIRA